MVYALIAVSFVLGFGAAWALHNPEIVMRHTKKKGSERAEDRKRRRMPFKRADALLDKDEAQLLKQIEWSTGKDLQVMPKVRLAEMVVVGPHERRDFYLNLAGSRCVDFLLCDPKTTKPVLAVLNDAEKESQRDDVVLDILRAAKVPRLHLSAKKVYPPTALKKKIREALQQHVNEEAESQTIGRAAMVAAAAPA